MATTLSSRSIKSSSRPGPMCTTYHGNCLSGRYRVCTANQYLVKTGLGVKDVMWGQKTFQWPFQTVIIIPMEPRQLEFDLNMMSSEMVPFKVPMVWTVGPYRPDVDVNGFLAFARQMSSMNAISLEETVAGVVHGTARTMTARISIKDLFQDRERFKIEVHDMVEKALKVFGIQCFNSNIAEMKDLNAENKYFENLKQKALEGASADARIQVAEARKQGDIGEKSRQADAKVEIAQINSHLQQQENTRQADVAQSNRDLQLVRYECKQQEESKRIETEMAPKRIQAETQTELNRLKANQQAEFLRSTQLAQTIVDNEGRVLAAEAEAQATRTKAEAELYAQQKQAEGLLARAKAQAEGLRELLGSSDPSLVKFYLALDKGLFGEMADKTAAAIQGLQPRVNIWSTGEGGEGTGFGALKGLFSALPPILDAVQSQTDIKMPSWMPQLSPGATTVPEE